VRLDKFIAGNSALSRKEAKRAARNGEVKVNGVSVKDLSQNLQAEDNVELFGRPLEAISPIYLMLNKPEGVISATDDNQQMTVMNLLADTAFQAGDTVLINALEAGINLQIVGRLDIDTTGLLFITDDGQWNHRVTSPNQNCGKTYRVQLAEAITETAIRQLETGVLLHDANKATAPAQVTVVRPQELMLTIYEGQYHQVKRMLAAVGNAVTGLHREQIGDVVLDSDLALGQYRLLTTAEINSF